MTESHFANNSPKKLEVLKKLLHESKSLNRTTNPTQRQNRLFWCSAFSGSLYSKLVFPWASGQEPDKPKQKNLLCVKFLE